jgi:uncharacterized protein (TIGR02118 family)
LSPLDAESAKSSWFRAVARLRARFYFCTDFSQNRGRTFDADHFDPGRFTSFLASAPVHVPGAFAVPPRRYTQEEAMIKVSVMYPNTAGARFDHAYYRDKHMPLVKRLMGDKCLFYTVDKGLAGGAPGEPAPYVGMCHIFSDSVEAFQAGFGPHAKEILADIANYTDLEPVMQVSEVVVGQ